MHQATYNQTHVKFILAIDQETISLELLNNMTNLTGGFFVNFDRINMESLILYFKGPQIEIS